MIYIHTYIFSEKYASNHVETADSGMLTGMLVWNKDTVYEQGHFSCYVAWSILRMDEYENSTNIP
jgi:hypothetical protein